MTIKYFSTSISTAKTELQSHPIRVSSIIKTSCGPFFDSIIL
nr:MAG TPA: protein of unknown function (DUF3536) [Caudoviricetes sp.]